MLLCARAVVEDQIAGAHQVADDRFVRGVSAE